MSIQNNIDFERIKAAIGYIHDNFKMQPELDKVAAFVHLSPFHFQRLFSDWAGVSPKKFLQYTTIAYAKHLLKNEQLNLFETAYSSGLSGTSRLHDLFISIEGMTPAEYQNGGKNLQINYSFNTSPFGEILVASTAKGICYMAFVSDEIESFKELKNEFPKAIFQAQRDTIQQNALTIFQFDEPVLQKIKLHLKGTQFQIKVWQSLLKIPMGQLSSYGKIALALENKNASRAVGTAIGSNPVAYLIPCHRVIQASGITTGYRWGSNTKRAIIGWEAVKMEALLHS